MQEAGLASHKYADDCQDYVHCTTNRISTALSKLQICFIQTREWMSFNRLKPNADKTEVMLFGPHHKLRKLQLCGFNLEISLVEQILSCLRLSEILASS